MANSQSAPRVAHEIPLYIAGRKFVVIDGRLDSDEARQLPYQALKDARRLVLDDLGVAHRYPSRDKPALIGELNVKLVVLNELLEPYCAVEEGTLLSVVQRRAITHRESLVARYIETGAVPELHGVSTAFATDIANVVYVGSMPADVTTALGTVTINTLLDMFESAVPIFAVLTPATKAELARGLANLQERLAASGS